MKKAKARLPQVGDVYTQANEYTWEQNFHVIEVRGIRATKKYGAHRPYRIRFLRFWRRDDPMLRTEYWSQADFAGWKLRKPEVKR